MKGECESGEVSQSRARAHGVDDQERQLALSLGVPGCLR